MSFEDFYGQRDSAYYQGMIAQGKGAANHLGMGERPSESHHWVPGFGWTFMPDYEVGESLSAQAANQADPTAGFNINVSKESLADAEKSGVTDYYSAQGQGMSREQSRAIRERQMSHDFYRSGLDHYAGEYDEAAIRSYVNERAGQNTISPWVNIRDGERQSSYDAYMEDNYNPFIGNEGAWVTPEGNDLRGSNNGTAEGYRDDSISAYLKHAFSGEDQVQNRANALNAFKKWNGTERGINTATTRMNQRHFDSLGLGDFGLEYEGKAPAPAEFVPKDVSGGWNPAGMMTGGARPDPATPANVGGGGFMAAYQAKRDELANKPSVMSLMTELKDA